jgi:uncharacterized protein with HEPN domain
MLLEADVIRARHMIDAAREAQTFAAGKSLSDFETDRQLLVSVVYCLLSIGEAARHMSPECRVLRPEVPWEDTIGMRNRLVHAYFDINVETVWRTVVEDLPPLTVAAEAIVASADYDPTATPCRER